MPTCIVQYNAIRYENITLLRPYAQLWDLWSHYPLLRNHLYYNIFPYKYIIYKNIIMMGLLKSKPITVYKKQFLSPVYNSVEPDYYTFFILFTTADPKYKLTDAHRVLQKSHSFITSHESPIPRQFSKIHIQTLCFFGIHFHIILQLTSRQSYSTFAWRIFFNKIQFQLRVKQELH